MKSSRETQVPPSQIGSAGVSEGGRVGREAASWQLRLLPMMSGVLLTLAAFFFIASCVQLVFLHLTVIKGPRQRVDTAALYALPEREFTVDTALELAELRTLAAFEAAALERRHHHAAVSLMSKLWSHYLGFVTGMIISLVGATFVLGRLTEAPSELRTSVEALKVSINTTSPGLILVLLGVLLMALTIVTRQRVEVSDASVYLSRLSALQNAAESDSGTASIPELIGPSGEATEKDNEDHEEDRKP